MYDAEYILHSTSVPKCEKCGGDIKPDVVLYEEGLDNHTIQEAVYYISNADMLIIGGTSLAVYPAAGLIDYYQGDKLVLVNKSATARDGIANLVLQESIGELFGKIVI
jgi:NAD-dependent deacetylase